MILAHDVQIRNCRGEPLNYSVLLTAELTLIEGEIRMAAAEGYGRIAWKVRYVCHRQQLISALTHAGYQVDSRGDGLVIAWREL